MTATILEADVDSIVDLSDLDLLDDEHRHLRCMRCFPGSNLPFGVIYVGKCGKRAVSKGRPIQYTPPPDACPKCIPLQGQPCRRCQP